MAIIDWLGGWLKSIILIVLLAAFIDLILPNYSMQRYVKTVISLFLLITLLTPIFQILQKNWDFNEWIGKVVDATDTSISSGNRNHSLALQTILMESEKLKDNGTLQAKQLLEEQTAQWIMDDIEYYHGLLAKEVKVNAEIDSRGEASIRQVIVHLSQEDVITASAERAPNESSPNSIPEVRGMKPIEPIRPIQIEVERMESFTENQSVTSSNHSDPFISSKQEELKEQLVQTIRQALQAPIGQIIVSFL